MKKLPYLLLVGTLALPLASQATPVTWIINAGGWGYESSWQITQQSGGTWSYGMDQGTMNSYEEYAFDWDLTPGDYLLTMADTYGDGLDHGGYAELIVNGDTLLNCGACFSSSYHLTFNVPTTGNVPEPATLMLMGLGLAGIGYRRKLIRSMK